MKKGEIERLAHFLHEHILYSHPDPAGLHCNICEADARAILEFLTASEFMVTDVEICQ